MAPNKVKYQPIIYTVPTQGKALNHRNQALATMMGLGSRLFNADKRFRNNNECIQIHSLLFLNKMPQMNYDFNPVTIFRQIA